MLRRGRKFHVFEVGKIGWINILTTAVRTRSRRRISIQSGIKVAHFLDDSIFWDQCNGSFVVDILLVTTWYFDKARSIVSDYLDDMANHVHFGLSFRISILGFKLVQNVVKSQMRRAVWIWIPHATNDIVIVQK